MRKGKRFGVVAMAVCMVINSLSVCMGGNVITARAAESELTITGPTAGEVVYPYSNQVKTYVTTENADITQNYTTGSTTTGDTSIVPVYIEWADSADSTATKYVVEYATESDYSDAISVTQEDVDTKQIAVYNLYKASTYYVRVTAYAGDTQLSQAESTFQTTDQGPRIMNIDSTHNVRDLGGYATTGGKTTLQGMIYRGCELDGYQYTVVGKDTCRPLSDAGKAYMSDVLGIKTDIDLRQSGEVASTTSPITSATRVNHATGYKLNDTSYQASYKAIFELLADESNYPVYIHCWGGADRTGRVAYMINALLGVSEEDLIRDFEMTSYSIFGLRKWVDWDTSEYANMDLDSIDADEVKAADTDRTLEFQYYLNLYGGDATTPAGKVENYLVNTCGVSAEDIASFRAIMLGESTSGGDSGSGDSGEDGGEGDSGEETPTPTYFKVEAETFDTTTAVNTAAYSASGTPGIKIGSTVSQKSSATWTVTVENAGTYTITTLGTGLLTNGAYSNETTDNGGELQGTLTIGDGAGTTVSLNVGGYNNFVDYGETSTLGNFELSAGTYTIKLELDAGTYTMDYMEFTPVTAGSGDNGGSGDETPTTITVEGETYNTSTAVNSGTYTHASHAGKAAVHLGSGDKDAVSSATWSVTVDAAGTYTIKTVGTGEYGTDSSAVTGTLYIGETKAADAVTLTVHNGWNCFENALETTLCTVELAAGTHTIKLEINGGRYIMDKMILTPEETGDSGDGSGTGDDSGSGNETPTTITVEGETYDTSTAVNSGTYTHASHAGKAAVHLGSGDKDAVSSATWSVTVDAAGTYTVKTIGTGEYGTNSSAITGTLYIGETKAADAVTLTVHNGWNCFENALETTLCTVELAAGTHTIKLEVSGGRYIMDYMVLTLVEAAAEAPDLSNPLITIEAEDYTEGYSEDDCNQTGYYSEVNDGPIDISISYNDGETIRYRAVFTNGDWATYTVNVATAGAYWIVVNGIGAGEFYLDAINNPIPFECADDGNGIVANIMLSAGGHTIKILAPTYLDMDCVSLYAGGSGYMTTDDVASYVPPTEVEIDKDAVQLEIYVAPNGNDTTNSGTQDAPFATMARAREEVRKYNDNMTGNIIVHFAPGYYQLDETEVFDEEDSGTNGYSIIYKGDSETESSLISGGTKIEGWAATTLLGGKIWKASTEIEDTRNLYVNGYPAQRARGSYQYKYTENLEPEDAKHQDNYNLADQPGDVRSSGIKVPAQDIFLALEHPEDVELVWPNQWVHQRTPVLDIYADPDDDSLVVFEMDMPYWEWANTKEAPFTNPVYWDWAAYPDTYSSAVNEDMTFYLENALALLDEPGEFYFDKTTKEMYYYPYAEEDLTTAEVYAGTTEFMIQVIGSGATGRVENITFDNLDFRYGAWTEPNTTGVQITQTDHIVDHRRTNTAYGGKTLPGQITFNFTRNVNVYNCEFRCLGSSALVMDNGVADTEVVGNVFMDISGTGIMIDSYEHRGILPEGRVRCDNILVADNVIHRPANQYYGMTGISMYLPSNTIVRNNDIEDTPYSGMIAGWGWATAAAVASANNKILDNKIVNVMQVLTDGGHIYTLDRVHNLEIAGNYLAKSGDWRGGIYLDEGSRSFDIHDNVVEDSERWFFGRNGAQIEDIELYDNYYDAASKSDIASTVVTDNNTAVARGTDDTLQWPQGALDIIANAGLEAEYEGLLAGTELPEWRADVIDTMPEEVIEGPVEETPTTVRVEGESFMDSILYSYNSEAYTPGGSDRAGVKIGATRTKSSWATWNVEVATAGTYTITALGTGYIVNGADDVGGTLQGTLSINDGDGQAVSLTVHGRNDYVTYGTTSTLGQVELSAGINTIKLALSGGRYTMDYMELTLNKVTLSNTANGDVNYATFTEAFAAAESGDTITLNTDMELSGALTTEAAVVVQGGSTLDLKGYALTVGSLATLSGGKVVDNSADKSGVLKMEKGTLLLPADNSQMPVWNGKEGDEGGYVFATMKAQEVYSSTDKQFSLVFKPSFGTMFNGELFGDGMDDNEVEVRVLLTWTDASGASKSESFTYVKDKITQVYGGTKAFLFSLKGFGNVTDVAVTTMVISDSGVKWQGETYNLN